MRPAIYALDFNVLNNYVNICFRSPSRRHSRVAQYRDRWWRYQPCTLLFTSSYHESAVFRASSVILHLNAICTSGIPRERKVNGSRRPRLHATDIKSKLGSACGSAKFDRWLDHVDYRQGRAIYSRNKHTTQVEAVTQQVVHVLKHGFKPWELQTAGNQFKVLRRRDAAV